MIDTCPKRRIYLEYVTSKLSRSYGGNAIWFKTDRANY